MLKFPERKDAMLIEEDPFPPIATVNTIDADHRTFLDLKKKLKEREENWDTLGQPSKKYDYKVKYSRPLSANIPMKSITHPDGELNLEGRNGYLGQNRHSTRMSMAIIGDNQAEHGTIGDLFRIGIHQRAKMSFQFKNQSFFIILTFLGISIIITDTHLEEMRMSLLQGL